MEFFMRRFFFPPPEKSVFFSEPGLKFPENGVSYMTYRKCKAPVLLDTLHRKHQLHEKG